MKKLMKFIETKISQKVIDQDLNFLLPADRFQAIRRILGGDGGVVERKKIIVTMAVFVVVRARIPR